MTPIIPTAQLFDISESFTKTLHNDDADADADNVMVRR